MAPVVEALNQADDFDCLVAVTGQHREMLAQVNELFGIVPSVDLDLMRQGQSLADLTARTLGTLTPVLEELKPGAVVVQGDTTSAFAASLAAFYQQIPVFHVEAGLRTNDRYNPFPEEMNRRLTGRIAALHLAPTTKSKTNLLREGVPESDIAVTGNTVIDAFLETTGRIAAFDCEALQFLDKSDERMVLVTAHRRESWGEPLRRAAKAVGELASRYPNVWFVLPLHANPLVRETFVPIVGEHRNVIVLDPQPYGDFSRLIARSTVVLTDSGGVQEEAPALGKPVLVMRDNTERPEAVDAGVVRLVGTDPTAIVGGVSRLLDNESAYAEMSHAVNPYGDGHAAARTIAAFRQYFGIGERLQDFGWKGSDPR